MVGFLVNNTLGDGFEAKTQRLFFLIHVGIEGVKHWDVMIFFHVDQMGSQRMPKFEAMLWIGSFGWFILFLDQWLWRKNIFAPIQVS
jgi:hypothetical protein